MGTRKVTKFKVTNPKTKEVKYFSTREEALAYADSFKKKSSTTESKPKEKPKTEKLKSFAHRFYNTSDWSSLFGETRRGLVSRHYGDNNPFKLANDAVGNAVSDIGLTMLTGAGAYNLGKLIVVNGTRAIPGVLGAVAGAAGGLYLYDLGVQALTGKTADEQYERGGMDSYGRALFKPGAWGGSIVGGLIGNGVFNNGLAWYLNSNPRMAMTPQGPVMVLPGETITLLGRPVGYQEGTQGNFGYGARYTTKSGGGRGSAAGLSGRVQTSQGIGNQRISSGVQPRVMSSQVPSRVGSRGYSFSNEWTPYLNGFRGWIPWQAATPGYRYVKLTPETHEEEEPITYDSDFIKWYGKQDNNTILYFEGSPGHPAMWVKIDRSGNPPTSRTVTKSSTTREVGDQQGYIIPDSSSVILGKAEGPRISKVEGAVPAKARRSKKKIFD